MVDVSRLPAIGRSTTVAKDLAAVAGRFEIVLNWQEELKQRVPLRP